MKLIKRAAPAELQRETKQPSSFCHWCSPIDYDFGFFEYENEFFKTPEPLVEFDVPPDITFEIPMDIGFERQAKIFCKKFCRLQQKKINGTISKKKYQEQLRRLWELYWL